MEGLWPSDECRSNVGGWLDEPHIPTRACEIASHQLPALSVAQLGARMHYAVPRILHAAGALDRLFTDATATSWWTRSLRAVPKGLRPPALKRLLARVPSGVPRYRITAFERFGWEYAWRFRCVRGQGQEIETRVHLWSAKKFCQLVLASGIANASGFYGFNGASLELLECTNGRGLYGILEQTSAPVDVEDRLLAAEREANPGWEIPPAINSIRKQLGERERGEWQLASLILCASEFVRRGIAECGGPVERCVVVPYGVDGAGTQRGGEVHDSVLRVLICGAVGLRKGARYAFAAARVLRGIAQFRWVGSIGVLRDAASRLADHIDLRGSVPRTAMPREYAWADVFFLPTVCEGSATVCYEAMAAGLPVITTPNAGSVVRDGLDGFVVPVGDAEAIAAKLELLSRDRELLAWMSTNARQRAQEFTLEKYGERLIATIRNSMARA